MKEDTIYSNMAHMARNIKAACFVRRIRKQGRTYLCDDDRVGDVGEPFGFDLTVAVSSYSLLIRLLESPSCGPLTGTDFTTTLSLLLCPPPSLISVSDKRPDARLERCVNTLPLILLPSSYLLFYSTETKSGTTARIIR